MTNRKEIEVQIDELEARCAKLFEESDYEDTDATIDLQDEIFALEQKLDELNEEEEDGFVAIAEWVVADAKRNIDEQFEGEDVDPEELKGYLIEEAMEIGLDAEVKDSNRPEFEAAILRLIG
jgi:hypothetical protein